MPASRSREPMHANTVLHALSVTLTVGAAPGELSTSRVTL